MFIYICSAVIFVLIAFFEISAVLLTSLILALLISCSISVPKQNIIITFKRFLLGLSMICFLVLLPHLYFDPVLTMNDRSGNWFLMNLILIFLPAIFSVAWLISGTIACALAAFVLSSTLLNKQDSLWLNASPFAIAPAAATAMGIVLHLLPDSFLQVLLPSGRSFWSLV